MAKLFGGIFGRAERSASATSPTIVIDGEVTFVGAPMADELIAKLESLL